MYFVQNKQKNGFRFNIIIDKIIEIIKQSDILSFNKYVLCIAVYFDKILILL